jgi:hypothetical protein
MAMETLKRMENWRLSAVSPAKRAVHQLKS